MFVSERYQKKLWTNVERNAALAKAFHENQEYILPVRLDDTEVAGISTISYLDMRKHSIEWIFERLSEELSAASRP